MRLMRVRTPDKGFVNVPAGSSYRGIKLESVPTLAAALNRLYRYHSDFCPELFDFFEEEPADFIKNVMYQAKA